MKPSKLAADKDWTFSSQATRGIHFECLNFDKPQRAVAAQAVMGLRFKKELRDGALRRLGALGLKRRQFIAVHLRRSDFRAPGTAAKAAEAVRKLASSGPVLLSSNARDGDGSFVDAFITGMRVAGNRWVEKLEP